MFSLLRRRYFHFWCDEKLKCILLYVSFMQHWFYHGCNFIIKATYKMQNRRYKLLVLHNYIDWIVTIWLFFQRLLIQVAFDWRLRCRKVMFIVAVCWRYIYWKLHQHNWSWFQNSNYWTWWQNNQTSNMGHSWTRKI